MDRFDRSRTSGVASRDLDENTPMRADSAPPRREVRRNLASSMRSGKYDSESEESKPLLSDDESDGGRRALPPLRKKKM